MTGQVCAHDDEAKGLHLGAVKVSVMLQPLDLILWQGLIEGQHDLHIVPSQEARSSKPSHDVAQATDLQAYSRLNISNVHTGINVCPVNKLAQVCLVNEGP